MLVTGTIRRAELLLTGDQHGKRREPMGRMYFSLPPGGGQESAYTTTSIHGLGTAKKKKQTGVQPARSGGQHAKCTCVGCGDKCAYKCRAHMGVYLPRVRDCPERTTDCT